MKLVSIIFYPKPHPIFYKDSESREQRQIENVVFRFGYAKAHPIFFKNRTAKRSNKTKTQFLTMISQNNPSLKP